MEEAMTDSTVNRHLLESESIAERWSEVSASLSRLMNWMDSKEGWVVGVDSEFLDLLAKRRKRITGCIDLRNAAFQPFFTGPRNVG